MVSTVAFSPQSTQPIDELIGFLKQSDNYTQDTRNWPDPTEPRAAKPPELKGCTCQQGQKLDCPIHGMHADPDLAELDHTWSMPQAQPIGYQQDGPRNWTQAVSSVSDEAYVRDTSIQANQHQADHQTSLSSNDPFPDVECPGRSQAGNRLQRRQFGFFGSEAGKVPKFDSFMVTNRQSQSVKGNGDLVNMEKDFVPFGIVKRGSPIRERIENHPQGFGYIGVNRSRFRRFKDAHEIESPVVIRPEHANKIGQQITEAHTQACGPQAQTQWSTSGQIKDNGQPASDIRNPEHHKWSVTRVTRKAIKLRAFKPGKWGKGIISEDGSTVLTWRTKGWNGSPHHDEVYDVLQVEPTSDTAFHVAKDCKFYFHDHDEDFSAPEDPAKLARCIEKEFPTLHWGKISVEDYEQQMGITE